jgi:protein O-GlcNAc transferase
MQAPQPVSVTLTLVDGVRIVVPDSLELITPYVLREQADWFEDELKFLRRLTEPGQTVVDIGANYGAYALCLARKVGATGHVWAFEPASVTAEFLGRSVAANGFAQVTLEQSALSDRRGSAHLFLHTSPELNALQSGRSATGETESVALTTLDACLETLAWRDIDFVKIDAEGEEMKILAGGTQFFARLSPLIQYEVMAGPKVNLELVQAFAARGYESYRLVPGLDLLAPFDANSRPDAFLLNLFCCKPDKAARLAAAGKLVRPGQTPASSPDDGAYHWRRALGALPYGKALAGLWEQSAAAGQGGAVEVALSLFAQSRDAALPATVRFQALEESFSRFKTLCASEASPLRLVSLARVARSFGARQVAVEALGRVVDEIRRQGQVDVSEPFLAPNERFDVIAPGEAVGNWLLSAVFEEQERAGSFSSFYTGQATLKRLELILAMGFGSDEMTRRLALVRQRHGAAPS